MRNWKQSYSRRLFMVLLLICYCQSDFTVFVTKLLIRQFTLLIYIFTNHYSHYSPLNRVLQILCTYFCKSVLQWLPKKKQLNKVTQITINTKSTISHSLSKSLNTTLQSPNPTLLIKVCWLLTCDIF